ncbi:fatty acid amide hydrolase [Dorcoceras hygrometricum]|uniref:Fatty acid amide hydrolase n=1 Tax=Dorcoceras hygrometricum TaxID=472368 RepID=A0A2Z7BUP3_9LAMI|nr:fatty acid amide hydrolase [Dorcoceras hygrometricum]
MAMPHTSTNSWSKPDQHLIVKTQVSHKDSTTDEPEVTVEMTPEVDKQADDTSNAAEQEERVECENQTEKECQDGNVSTIAQGENVESTAEDETGVGNRETFMEARHESAQPAQQSTNYTGKRVYDPVEIWEINWVTHFLPKIDPNIRDRGECQLQVYDQWRRFYTSYWLSNIPSMKIVEEFAKIENKLFSWAETDKVSEMLQRRELIWYKMMELHMREAVAENLKNFYKDKPSANQDIMAIRMLEDELAKTMKSVNLFQARADLPVTYHERSKDRVASLKIIPSLTWEEYKAQLAQPTQSTPDKRMDQEQEHQNPEQIAEGQIEEIARTVKNVEELEAEHQDPEKEYLGSVDGQ